MTSDEYTINHQNVHQQLVLLILCKTQNGESALALCLFNVSACIVDLNGVLT